MKTIRQTLLCVVALSATAVGPAMSQEVATTYEDEWISLAGTVETVLATSFVLDYGEDDITVELDKFDWAVDRSDLFDRQVNVIGRMDRNLYDNRSIEAAVVYVPSLGEYLYADPEDEEGDPSVTRSFAPGMFSGTQVGDWVAFSGRVTGVEDNQIMVESAMSTLTVDTSLTPDVLVAPSVEVGDRVLVTGEMEGTNFFEEREVEANSVARLIDLGR